MNELWWLILPIAAGIGALISKYHTPQQRFPADYFKGLRYLLNEQPDKAIDVFTRLLDVDAETAETQLALGALFRKRGEVDRAIVLHQKLLSQRHLLEQQRQLLLIELGEDYLSAGLLDRAEAIFQELSHAKAHRRHALQQLLDIYQQEHDWQRSITTAAQLAKASGNSLYDVIAQCYCELAVEAAACPEQRAQFLQQALTSDPACVRASLLEAEFAMQQQQFQQAITAYQRVAEQDSRFLPEVMLPLQSCYQALNAEQEFIAYLEQIVRQYPYVTIVLLYASYLHPAQKATDFLVQQLHQRPSIRGLNYLLNLALTDAQLITHEHLLLLKDALTELLREHPIYQCQHCGFQGKTLHWQCPSCKQWNTTFTRQDLHGE